MICVRCQLNCDLRAFLYVNVLKCFSKRWWFITKTFIFVLYIYLPFSIIWSGEPNYSSWLNRLWYTTMVHFHVAFINRLLPAGRSFSMSDVQNLSFHFQESMKHIMELSYPIVLLSTTNNYDIFQLLWSRLLWDLIWFIRPVIVLLHVTTDLLLLFFTDENKENGFEGDPR